MIDKQAGLPTQIRNLEKRLKEMDASKVKPALIKEITDTIKNLKEMLKEKQEKREQRKREKEEKAKEVEAAPNPNAVSTGATSPNDTTALQPGQPEATPVNPMNPSTKQMSCPLCGGMTFPDQAAYQQHMEFTHKSDIMPTSPEQKLDKTVAAIEVKDDKVEMPKAEFVKEHEKLVDELAPIVEEHKEQGAELKEVKEAGPMFKLDDVVKPVRGSESLGKVMRWDGKPNDLVYVMWDSGPLKERDVFGGYYPHDLQPHKVEVKSEPAPCPKCEEMQTKQGDLRGNYEALLKDLKEERDAHFAQGNSAWVARLDQKIHDLEQAIKEKFGGEQTITSDLAKKASTDYYFSTPVPLGKIKRIKDLKVGKNSEGSTVVTDGENYVHLSFNDRGLVDGCTRFGGNNPEMILESLSDVVGEIKDEYQMQEEWAAEDEANHKAPGHKCDEDCMLYEYPDEKKAAVSEPCPKCKHGMDDHDEAGNCAPCVGKCGSEKTATGGPELIREVHKAKTGFGYEATVYDLTNGRFQQNVPLKIEETHVRRRQPENGLFELKYPGMDWRPVLQPEFDQWLAQWKEVNQKNHPKEAGAQNAEQLTVMDHTPPRANSGPDAGGKDPHDEYQDEWAMPVTSATKINVLKRELLATPVEKGYDISADGKKLFNIIGKENKPMNKKQLEFCAEIELTRGVKQAKLVGKIAFLDKGTKVYILAEDKNRKRVKFASLDHGVRGWIPVSKVAFVSKEAEPMRHGDHMDDVLGSSKSSYLCECPQGSGQMRWIPGGELLSSNQPPATPESLGDIESSKKTAAARVCHRCGKGHLQEAAETPGAYWFKCDNCSEKMSVPKNDKEASVKKEAGVTWHDVGIQDPPENAVRVQHQSGIGGTIVSLNDKFANVKMDTPVKREDLRRLGISEIQFDRGDHPKGVYAIYAEGFDASNGAPAWTLFDANNQPILPEGYKLPDHDKNPNPEPAIDTESAKECPDCKGHFEGAEGEKCPTCGRFAVMPKEGLKQALPPIIPNERAHVNAELNKEARVVHRDDGWHVLSEEGKNLGGPYDSEEAANKRLKQVEYFKHKKGSFKPFSKKADVFTDLATHVTEVKDRITQTQEQLQNVPAVKVADATTPPVIQNVQPTDDDNLDVSIPAPTSPLPPGQKWVFDTQFNKYVAMPDPNQVSKQV